jgi:hypothetical protein
MDKQEKGLEIDSAQAEAAGTTAEVTAAHISEMSSLLLKEAEELRNHIDASQVQLSIQELKNSTAVFRAIAEAALAPQPRPGAAAAPAPEPRVQHDCGCQGQMEGCDPARLPSCCVELYIKHVDVLWAGIGELNRLELIVAVRGLRSWGLSNPGIAGYISVDRRTGPVPIGEVIERHCVPCGGSVTIPLWFQAREVESGVPLSGAFEGKDEVGSEVDSITLFCDCATCERTKVVPLKGNTFGEAGISITVAARVIPGGCC